MDVKEHGICGTCKYYKLVEGEKWICTCVDSDLCGKEIEYDYGCQEYKNRWMLVH